MECSRNDESETQYYVVILDWLQGCSEGLERALESHVRGPLTNVYYKGHIERMRMDMCDLGKTEVILGML